uniref:Major capsid protein n=1 Tax=Siphoviridae sp. ctrCv3 TaxID=2827954 RepID=A0A8S5SCK0_9CAUD|nr:MAG TPA: Major capsid protein [Siphoviridae sp. ctrCv3]
MAVTTFIPELWSARLLYALEKAHVATNLVNRNYEGEISNHGDTVHINTIGAITVKSYTKNTDIDAPETLTTTDQTLVIDQAKYFNFQVDDVDKVQAAGELVDTAMGRAAYALADVSDAYLLGVIAAGAAAGNTIGSAAAPVALTASNVYENIVKLKTKLDKANVPNTGRTIVVPPDVHSLLLLDDRFAKSTATAGQEALINGLVGRIAGFDVYMSNNVKTGTGTDTGKTPYFEITAQITDATTYAEQIIKTEAYRMESRFADAVKGLHVYGAKVTDGTKIAKILASVS